MERVPIRHLVEAAQFYAAFPLTSICSDMARSNAQWLSWFPFRCPCSCGARSSSTSGKGRSSTCRRPSSSAAFPGSTLSVRFHGHRASTPLGPAAGPHDQLVQNIVLSWLGGSRIIELKTVQILDELKIPRPCIDVANVGYNVEWSQELRLEQSLREYVGAAMFIEILKASKLLGEDIPAATRSST